MPPIAPDSTGDAPLPDSRKPPQFFLLCSSTSTGGTMLRCTMNRAMRHRHQLSRAGDEIESVLAFSKRVAFQLVEAACFLFVLYKFAAWLFR
jgi:hypothetical protein